MLTVHSTDGKMISEDTKQTSHITKEELSRVGSAALWGGFIKNGSEYTASGNSIGEEIDASIQIIEQEDEPDFNPALTALVESHPFASFPPATQLTCLARIDVSTPQDLLNRIAEGTLVSDLKPKGPYWYNTEQIHSLIKAMVPSTDMRRALLCVGWVKRSVFAKHNLPDLVEELQGIGVKTSNDLFHKISHEGGAGVFKKAVSQALEEFLKEDLDIHDSEEQHAPEVQNPEVSAVLTEKQDESLAIQNLLEAAHEANQSLFASFPPATQLACLARIGVTTPQQFIDRVAEGTLVSDLKPKGPYWYNTEQLHTLVKSIVPSDAVQRALLCVGWVKRSVFAKHSLSDLVEALRGIGVVTPYDLHSRLVEESVAAQGTSFFKKVVSQALVAFLKEDLGISEAVEQKEPEQEDKQEAAPEIVEVQDSEAANEQEQQKDAPKSSDELSPKPQPAAASAPSLFLSFLEAMDEASNGLFTSFPPATQLTCLARIGISNSHHLLNRITEGTLVSDLKPKGPYWYNTEQIHSLIKAMVPSTDMRRALLCVGWVKRSVFAKHNLPDLVEELQGIGVKTPNDLHSGLVEESINVCGTSFFKKAVSQALVEFLKEDLGVKATHVGRVVTKLEEPEDGKKEEEEGLVLGVAQVESACTGGDISSVYNLILREPKEGIPHASPHRKWDPTADTEAKSDKANAREKMLMVEGVQVESPFKKQAEQPQETTEVDMEKEKIRLLRSRRRRNVQKQDDASVLKRFADAAVKEEPYRPAEVKMPKITLLTRDSKVPPYVSPRKIKDEHGKDAMKVGPALVTPKEVKRETLRKMGPLSNVGKLQHYEKPLKMSPQPPAALQRFEHPTPRECEWDKTLQSVSRIREINTAITAEMNALKALQAKSKAAEESHAVTVGMYEAAATPNYTNPTFPSSRHISPPRSRLSPAIPTASVAPSLAPPAPPLDTMLDTFEAKLASLENHLHIALPPTEGSPSFVL